MSPSPYILTLTGPSCAGKSTLARKLIDTGLFDEAVSVTTRERRSGEINGIDYTFLSPAEFRRMRNEGLLVEAIEFAGNHYGLPANEFVRIMGEGKNVVAVVDPDGVRQVQAFCATQGWLVKSVFVDIDRETQMRRWVRRLVDDVRSYSACEDDRLVAAYARRLTDTLGVESEWHAALNYTLTVPSFDAETEAAVIARLESPIVDEISSAEVRSDAEALLYLDGFDHTAMQRSIQRDIEAWELSGKFPVGRCRSYVLDVMRAHPRDSIDSARVCLAYMQWRTEIPS